MTTVTVLIYAIDPANSAKDNQQVVFDVALDSATVEACMSADLIQPALTHGYI